MILWTIQPEEVYKNIMETGIYRCDFARSGMKDWKLQYDWLVDQMINRIEKKPAGTDYPVWAWFKWRGRRKKPDLRSERWMNGRMVSSYGMTAFHIMFGNITIDCLKKLKKK